MYFLHTTTYTLRKLVQSCVILYGGESWTIGKLEFRKIECSNDVTVEEKVNTG